MKFDLNTDYLQPISYSIGINSRVYKTAVVMALVLYDDVMKGGFMSQYNIDKETGFIFDLVSFLLKTIKS